MWNMTIQSNINMAELTIRGKTIQDLADEYQSITGRVLTEYVIRNIFWGRKKDPNIKVSKIVKGHEQPPHHHVSQITSNILQKS